LDVCDVLCDAEVVYEGQDCSWGNTAAAECDQRIQTRVVPVADVAFFDELDDLALGKDCSGDVETTVFALVGAVDL
jgi:hypothetical protein